MQVVYPATPTARDAITRPAPHQRPSPLTMTPRRSRQDPRRSRRLGQDASPARVIWGIAVPVGDAVGLVATPRPDRPRRHHQPHQPLSPSQGEPDECADSLLEFQMNTLIRPDAEMIIELSW